MNEQTEYEKYEQEKKARNKTLILFLKITDIVFFFIVLGMVTYINILKNDNAKLSKELNETLAKNAVYEDAKGK